MYAKRILLATIVVSSSVALLLARSQEPPKSDTGAAMTKAATAFLGTLTDAQREQATFDYDDKERLNWHYIPRVRKGLPLRDLEGKALKSAEAFIASGLSESGYDQTIRVMSLEEVLFILETKGTREERRERRHPCAYGG